jgi:hypothetical protein
MYSIGLYLSLMMVGSALTPAGYMVMYRIGRRQTLPQSNEAEYLLGDLLSVSVLALPILPIFFLPLFIHLFGLLLQ